MSIITDAYDPSVAVRRRHLPFAGSAKGREANHPVSTLLQSSSSSLVS